MTSLHQPAAPTSARRLGPRTHARATANFLEIKAADSLSGTGPPRHSLYTKVLANNRGLHTRTVIFTHSETNKNYTSNCVSSSVRAQCRQLARAPVKCKQQLIG